MWMLPSYTIVAALVNPQRGSHCAHENPDENRSGRSRIFPPRSALLNRRRRRILLILPIILLIVSGVVAENEDCRAVEVDRGGWMDEISEVDSWQALAFQSDGTAFIRTEGVKFVADLVHNRVYFLDMSLWENHYPFAVHVLGEEREVVTFNRQVYSGRDRSMVLGTLVRYYENGSPHKGHQEEYTFELSFRETLFNPGPVGHAFQLVRSKVFFASKLAFYPTNPTQLSELRVLREGNVPITLLETITTHLAYQPLTLGVAIGTIRVIEDTADIQEIAKLNSSDIAVFTEVPDELQPTAALVTFHLQTPLCHVALLCRNRKTPNMSVQTEGDQQLFQMHNDATVRLQVRSDGFTLEKISKEEFARAVRTQEFEQSSLPTVVLPIANDSVSGLLHVDQVLEFKEPATIVGAKASQFARIASVAGAANLLSTSFVLPFSIYLNVVRNLDLCDAHYPAPGVDVGKSLETIRNEILSRNLPESLVSDIVDRIHGLGWRQAIFRSSTNVEDLPAFNGAGLYESIVVHDVANHQLVADALLRVFASMWTYHGWSERAAFGIDQRMVAMAVLVQRFLGDEAKNDGFEQHNVAADGVSEMTVKANGVALTAAPTHVMHRVGGNRDPQMSFYVNALSGSSQRVTESRGMCRPEELIIHVPTLSRPLDVQLLAASSCKESVLNRDDANELARVFSQLHSSILGRHVGDKSTTQALDIEFLIVERSVGERHVEVLQARPIDVS